MHAWPTRIQVPYSLLHGAACLTFLHSTEAAPPTTARRGPPLLLSTFVLPAQLEIQVSKRREMRGPPFLCVLCPSHAHTCINRSVARTMKVPLSVALLLLGAAWIGKAQPPCPVRLARHGPATKTVMAGRGLTTTIKVTNTGREPVVVNVAIRLPDNVCASKDGTHF